MAHRTLEITLMSAKGLKYVNLFSKMAVYAMVSLSGDPGARKRTPPDREGGRQPSWNTSISLTVPADGDLAAYSLHILLRTERFLRDRDVGEVRVPLSELLAGAGDAPMPVQFVSYQVRRVNSGKPKGVLNFSYKLGERVPPAAAAANPAPEVAAYPPPVATYPPPSGLKADEPVMAYPAGTSSVGYPGYGAAPPMGYQQAPPYGYGYPPPGYGFGYPPPGYGFGYGPAPPLPLPLPEVQQQQRKNQGGMGLGAGLVGGAIGGLVIGGMISDAAAYDAGFDEAGGFN